MAVLIAHFSLLCADMEPEFCDSRRGFLSGMKCFSGRYQFKASYILCHFQFFILVLNINEPEEDEHCNTNNQGNSTI